jgi:hypothetical protein
LPPYVVQYGMMTDAHHAPVIIPANIGGYVVNFRRGRRPRRPVVPDRGALYRGASLSVRRRFGRGRVRVGGRAMLAALLRIHPFNKFDLF